MSTTWAARRWDTPAVSAPTAARTTPSSDAVSAWRPVLALGAGVLLLSVLLLLVLRTSANPAPGSAVHDAVAWVQEVATLVGAVLLGIGLAMWRTARR